MHLDSIVAPNTKGGAYSSLPCPVAVGTLYIYNPPSLTNILHIYNNKIWYQTHIFKYILIDTSYLLWIMVWTNTTLVRYSEFHAGGYPTIFSRIWLTKGKLPYNRLLKYNWRQCFVSYLESMYLLWCLHLDISSVFLFSKSFPQ